MIVRASLNNSANFNIGHLIGRVLGLTTLLARQSLYMIRKIKMNQFFVICAIAIFSSVTVFAADNKNTSSSTAQMTLSDTYSTKFKHAVDLLDGYRGDTSLLESARIELENILKDNPRYAPAYREMARYCIMKGSINDQEMQPGSLEAAESWIKKSIDFNPNFAEAYVLFGHLYTLMNRHQDAAAALQKAEKIGTTDPWLQNNWAFLLSKEGKYEEAAPRFQKVIDSNTQNKKAMGAAMQGLIQSFLALGKLDQADELYRKQIAYEPKTAWSYGNYAQFLLCQKDDYEQSISLSREALRLMDYGVGRYWLASALYRKWAQTVLFGRPDVGKQYFTEAQALYPDPNEIAGHAEGCAPLKMIAQALVRK